MSSDKIEFNPTSKQQLALIKLWDNTTREVGYGGSAGSGKSFLGCFWIIYMCLNFPGVSYGLCRRELTNLKKTTLISFYEVCKFLELQIDKDFNFNQQMNIIKFKNGSSVFLIDTAYSPADSLYTRFGGLLLTGCFIDESGETPYDAISILKTRIGRCENGKYNITPKLLETFNPSKNHVYTRYYLGWKEGSLPPTRVFVRALPTDNPHLPKSYIEQLEMSDEVTRQRLLLGNFEYDSDDRLLCSYNKINDVFTNTFVKGGEKYLTADLAMAGRDLFVVIYWDGLRGKIVLVKPKSTGKEVENDLRLLSDEYKVPRSNIIFDSDGLGSYLGSYLEGAMPFHANKAATNQEFRNLKSECAFKLSEIINKNEIFIECKDDKVRTTIIEEFGQLKRDDVDKDESKKGIIKKDEMKQTLLRSPDYLDCVLFRMLPEIKPKIEFLW